MTGRFIVLEGLDGAGTTTQAARLADSLKSSGRSVHLTAEPSDGPVGRLIREALQRKVRDRRGQRLPPDALAALFVADRADHLASEIEPALRRGDIVICDRYIHSSLAYQGVECDFDWIANMNAPMRTPDLVLWLDVNADIAAQRRLGRVGEDEIFEVDTFQRMVAAGYERAFSQYGSARFLRIDGEQAVDDVYDACRRALALCLAEGA